MTLLDHHLWSKGAGAASSPNPSLHRTAAHRLFADRIAGCAAGELDRSAAEARLDDYRHRITLRVCENFRRGIRTASETCGVLLCGCFEPGFAAEYMELLPTELRAALAELLPSLPDSDDGWAGFQGVGQLDGDEWSWADMVVQYRANTEAVRRLMFGQHSASVAVDFVDRIRAAYHKMLDDFRRTAVLQRRDAEPGAAPDRCT